MIRVKIYTSIICIINIVAGPTFHMLGTEDKKYNIANNIYKNYNVTGKVYCLHIYVLELNLKVYNKLNITSLPRCQINTFTRC